MKQVIIPLSDWAAGERTFRYLADTEFFQSFGNTEILDAHVNVEVAVRKEGHGKVEAVLRLSGTVTVPCTRCLEALALPVEVQPSEVLTPGEYPEWDLSQAVYDYVCLSLPIQRIHPEGECNPDTVRFLSQVERPDEEAAASSPFAALKGLFDSK